MVKKTGVAVLNGEKVKFKEGALHKMLKTPKGYTFTRAKLEQLKKKKNGNEFTFLGKTFVMSDLMKDRISFALVLMGKKK